ncbi:MAG: glycosyltransferase [Flavobacteriales bacterium]|nr:glycosyltransferase [Flavobacteriales bacterium]
MKKISASIVVYNTPPKILEQSIESFLNSDLSGELWIIDNTQNAEFSYLKKKYPAINYIFNNENLGYGKAHNIALRHFSDKSEYHLVLNPDVSFRPDLLTSLSYYLDKNKNTGLIAPKAIYPSGDEQSNGRLIPSPINLIFRRFIPDFLNIIDNNSYELKFNQQNNYLSPVILGSFMLFRNSSLKEIGFFDETFFLYPEDIDISRRMFEKYDNIIFMEKSFIHHHSQESYKSWTILEVHIKEMIKYFNKWGWIFDKKRKDANRKTLNQFS